ncbi:MAG: hypothetical protein PHT07_21240 [Paludibacter sp.]|nr:hypothetical protein [Paludibacter sp.]
MKLNLTSILLILFVSTATCQDFKYIKPILTDSTKVVKTEIDRKNQFERIYFIDYSKNSPSKRELIDFNEDPKKPTESINVTYVGILKNLKVKPQKFNVGLPEKWVKLFKYKGEWVLFNDLPKYILSDSCLISFDMDDPNSSIIIDSKSNENKYIFNLQSYNWDNPIKNYKSKLEIKIIDKKRMITLWRSEFQDQVSYELMIPVNQLSKFPIMVMLENDLMDDENELFDKIDLEQLWKN